MIERAVVLCAGQGSRLRPLTFSKPKHLLPVAGTPILGWALAALQRSGIKRVAIVVGHHAEAIRQYVGTGEAWDLDVTYLTQVQPLGIGHAVNLARDFVEDNPFVVYLGDNLFEDGLEEFIRGFDPTRCDAALLLKRVPDPQQFGVAQVDGSRVTAVVEKPKVPPSDLAIVGVYTFKPSVFAAIASLEPSGRGEIEITDAIQRLVAEGQGVAWTEVQGLWEDTGEPSALLRANREWLVRSELSIKAEGAAENCTLVGPVGIERGARAINCHITGPCRIGRNAVVRASCLGPDVTIGDGCEITNSRLRNCIVQRNSQVLDMTGGLVDSVLGEQVEVQGSPDGSPPAPLSLLLGDMARIQTRPAQAGDLVEHPRGPATP
jgi:glucose-1-phosphate thymidylyltransferase